LDFLFLLKNKAVVRLCRLAEEFSKARNRSALNAEIARCRDVPRTSIVRISTRSTAGAGLAMAPKRAKRGVAMPEGAALRVHYGSADSGGLQADVEADVGREGGAGQVRRSGVTR